jgi:hypothetical protein
MTIEMVAEDAEHDRDVEPGAKVLELEAGQLDAVDGAGIAALEPVQTRPSDVADQASILACGREHVGDERGGGRLALGAGHADDRAVIAG